MKFQSDLADRGRAVPRWVAPPCTVTSSPSSAPTWPLLCPQLSSPPFPSPKPHYWRARLRFWKWEDGDDDLQISDGADLLVETDRMCKAMLAWRSHQTWLNWLGPDTSLLWVDLKNIHIFTLLITKLNVNKELFIFVDTCVRFTS